MGCVLRRIPPVVSAVRLVRRKNQIRVRDGAATKYLRGPGPHRLHIGCANHIIDGWFNVDVFAYYAGSFYMDARKQFPFHDDAFDFIFSEHMIEHLEYLDATAMLHECFRVMKPGGTIRTSTPDFEFICSLYIPNGSAKQDEYKRAVLHTWRQDFGSRAVGVVVNNIYNFGHCFIYDRETLAEQMTRAGFINPEIRKPGLSPHPELSGIDVHHSDYISLESLVIEATKPY